MNTLPLKQAKTICDTTLKSEGFKAKIPVPQTEQENKDLLKVFRSLTSMKGRFALGFTDNQGQFILPDGKPTTYLNWLTGNPRYGTGRDSAGKL